VTRAASHLYTYWPDPRNQTWIRTMYINFISDALYVAPVDALVKLSLSLRLPTYQYVLNTTLEALKAPLWRQVPHNLQYYLLTGAPFMDPEFCPPDWRIERTAWTESDRNMSQLLIEAFANFAKYGRPTPQRILDTVSWRPALFGDQRFLSINNSFNSTMWSNFRQTESAFWTAYLPTLIEHELTTYRPTTEFWWEPKEPLQIAFWSVTALAFAMLFVVCLFCCLWQNNKRKRDRLYDETFMDGNMGVRQNSHFNPAVSKPPSDMGSVNVNVNDVSTATNQTTL